MEGSHRMSTFMANKATSSASGTSWTPPVSLLARPPSGLPICCAARPRLPTPPTPTAVTTSSSSTPVRRSHWQEARAEDLSDSLRLDRRSEGDQVPHPDAGEARAGHEGGCARHDAPQYHYQGFSDPPEDLSGRGSRACRPETRSLGRGISRR